VAATEVLRNVNEAECIRQNTRCFSFTVRIRVDSLAQTVRAFLTIFGFSIIWGRMKSIARGRFRIGIKYFSIVVKIRLSLYFWSILVGLEVVNDFRLSYYDGHATSAARGR
jgi:hypothetical protein